MQFDIEIIKPNLQTPVNYKTIIFKIAPQNKIDQSITEQFEIFFYTLIRAGVKRFLLDLNGLKYIDSSGIGKIINITKVLRKQGGNITIARVPQEIMQVFKLVKLDTFIKIFISVEEAVNFLKLV